MSLLIPGIHYGCIATIIILPAIGITIGQSLIGFSLLESIDRQPEARGKIINSGLLGMAITETSGVIGLGFSILLLFSAGSAAGLSLYGAIAEIGTAIAIGIPGFLIGLTSAFPAQEALKSIARQPFSAQKITNVMLLTQSLSQAAVIFGFITSLFIVASISSITTLNEALRLLSSGIAIGFGCLGPAYGLGKFAKTACGSLGLRPHAYASILPFTFVSEVLIETPIIFALVVALLLASNPSASTSWTAGIVYVCSALLIAIGTFSPGINSSRIATEACNQVSLNPSNYKILSKVSLLTQALIDTSVLYALIIALLLIYR